MTDKTAKFIDLCSKLEKQLRVIRQYYYERNDLFGEAERDDEYTEYVYTMRTLSLCLNLANELMPRLTLKDLED